MMAAVDEYDEREEYWLMYDMAFFEMNEEKSLLHSLL